MKSILLFLLPSIISLVKGEHILKESKLIACDKVILMKETNGKDEHEFTCESELGFCLTGFLEYQCDETTDRGYVTINDDEEAKLKVDSAMTTCQDFKFNYAKADKSVKFPVIAYCREPITGKDPGPINEEGVTTTTENTTTESTSPEPTQDLTLGKFDVRKLPEDLSRFTCCSNQDCDRNLLAKYKIIMGISGSLDSCFAEGTYNNEYKIVVLDTNDDVIYTNETLNNVDKIKFNVLQKWMKSVINSSQYQDISGINNEQHWFLHLLLFLMIMLAAIIY